MQLNKITTAALVSFSMVSVSSAANVLVNGDFESSLTTGWTINEGTPEIRDNLEFGFEAFGSTFFYGGSSETMDISQIIDVSANAAAIDAGNGRAFIAGAMGSWRNLDIGTFTLTFLDVASTDLGASLSLNALDNPTLETNDLTGAGNQELSSTVVVPVGTRTFSVVFSSTRTDGTDHDAYADNFVVDYTAVPEPSSAALLGLGGLALILRRRK